MFNRGFRALAVLLGALICGGLSTMSAAQAEIVAALLPTSRSVEVGNTATAFATIINAGSTAANNCGIALSTSISANFSYQTTNPGTNAVTGAPNTPVTIAPGGFQTFVIAISPMQAFAATDVAFDFSCTGIDPAPTLSGINTLLLTASAAPTPDIVALAATVSGNGTISIPATLGSTAFSVATVNLGAAGSVVVSADTGANTVPVSITICQTNPTTGACLATPSSTVTATIAADATPTFGIFVTGTGNVAPLPGADRVFVRFTSGGTVVGSTGVAVQTTGYVPPQTAGLSFVASPPSAATVGSSYNFCYCSPTPSGSNGLCGFPTQSNPSGGFPPYHFQLNSGVGFPPVGIILGLNGCLTGTPSVAGTSSFSVCAIDLNGSQICQPSSVTVQPGSAVTAMIEIGGDVATEATITLDGAVIKPEGSQNLDDQVSLALGNHTLAFSCPSGGFCFADLGLSGISQGFSVTPSTIDLSSTDLAPGTSVSRTFSVTQP